MIRRQNIICISSIDWDFVWQGHQEIMSAFARAGNRVLFIENTGVRVPAIRDLARLKKRLSDWLHSAKGFREAGPNLYVYSPVILPFPYSRIARRLNRYLFLNAIRRWMKAVGFYDPIIWTFLPTGIALDIVNGIERKLLVYYCIADFFELADNPKKVRRTEEELLINCDLVFAQGEVLRDKCLRVNRNVHIFPFGVKMEVFEEFCRHLPAKPEDIRSIPKPIIGYIGGVHRHIDFSLLRHLADRHPDWSIVMVGPRQVPAAELAKCRNIYFLGKKQICDIPAYINEFDVGIIPYSINAYTATVYPTKLNEYHALGKPVVSTALPEVLNFNAQEEGLVLVSRSHDEFARLVCQAMRDNSPRLVAKRKESAKRNSWTGRIERMSQLMDEKMAQRSAQSAQWQERLLKAYRSAKTRTLKALAVFLAAYLFVFYTPLVWFLAKPLRVTQPPERSDCILVFAGGTGESGKAGQGYEERVQFAVELYKKAVAKNIVFSSGYSYVFKEPAVMKALAVSLGVPEQAILLEEKAVNTYENIKFSRALIKKKGWHTVVIVSSPYHLRRVKLVAEKIAADLRINYAPIPHSLFFAHPLRDEQGRLILRRIKPYQAKAILHEYAAIIYYWIKGYI